MMRILERINSLVWGLPTLILIICVGIYLSACTGFCQITLFGRALRDFAFKCRPGRKDDNGTSSYRALCTALAATVGTGNIAGVAGAIAIGGPGAVFWMWVSAFLGMVTKFAEATLSVRYRVSRGNGEHIGGPMYMIEQGLPAKWKIVAVIYCFFGVVAALGVGNATQVNAVISGIKGAADMMGMQMSKEWDFVIGCVLSIIVGIVLLGGVKSIGTLAENLVPFASVFYILMAMWGIWLCKDRLPQAVQNIFAGAFQPNAVTGGAIGSIFLVLRTGASKGVFTNEAGMGTASIAHAGADVEHPCQQGLMGIMEVFIDTIVICTLTALVILTSGVDISYGLECGPQLTIAAFTKIYGKWIVIPLAFSIGAFAIATIFGWGLYGLRCAQYLFGDGAWKVFSILQSAAVLIGAVLGTGTVWLLSETVNGLMAIPNLIALVALSPELKTLTRAYKLTAQSSIILNPTKNPTI